MHHNLETLTCDPFKYTMGSPILIVSICMGQSIRIQRVKAGILLIPFSRHSCLLSSAVHLLIYFDSLYCEQYQPRSDCFHRNSLIMVRSVCFHDKISLEYI